jgi:hypothetical protein
MTAVDILGWVATGVIVLSFTVKDMWRLRIVNSVGTLLWLVYGGVKGDYPLLVVNALILAVHLNWFREAGGRKTK